MVLLITQGHAWMRAHKGGRQKTANDKVGEFD